MHSQPAADTDLQRSHGKVQLGISRGGSLEALREEGCAKLRMPHHAAPQIAEAIIINTAGGLAGGDSFAVELRTAGDICLTTQAAEKIYPSLGSTTRMSTRLHVNGTARVIWLPQEAIVFDGARLDRSLEAELDEGSHLLAVESVVLGRKAMGEDLTRFSLHDRWRISCRGRLVFADGIRLDENTMHGKAELQGAGAFAMVVCIGSQAETLLEPLRQIIGDNGAVSAWNGKLIARLVARDGFELRKSLVPALKLLAAPAELPKVWTL